MKFILLQLSNICLLVRFPDGSGVCLYFNLLEMFNSVLSSIKIASHLRNTCKRLRIVAIVRSQDDDMEVEEVSSGTSIASRCFFK